MESREYKDFNDGLNSKVELKLYKSFFCRIIELKNYLQGVGDPGTRLLFKVRSSTNGLNDELGRHRGKNDDRTVSYVGMNVKVSCMYSGSVLHMIA